MDYVKIGASIDTVTKATDTKASVEFLFSPRSSFPSLLQFTPDTALSTSSTVRGGATKGE